MNDTFADVLAINQIIVPIRSYFISDFMFTQYKKTYTMYMLFFV